MGMNLMFSLHQFIGIHNIFRHWPPNPPGGYIPYSQTHEKVEVEPGVVPVKKDENRTNSSLHSLLRLETIRESVEDLSKRSLVMYADSLYSVNTVKSVLMVADGTADRWLPHG